MKHEWRGTYLSQLKPSLVHTYGFRSGKRTADVTSILKELLHYATTWRRKVFVASQDVETAFDSMCHDYLMEAMLQRGLHPMSVLALMRELTGLSATISIPGAGCTDAFEFSRGGKQGGIVTPDEFSMFIEYMMTPIVKRWHARGLGFRFESGVIVTHLLWADNVWLVAEKSEDLALMIQELSLAISLSKLKWKSSSLEVMAGGLACCKRALLF